MKANLTMVFSFFLALFANGQEKEFQMKLIDENYTWRTASPEQLDSFYFDLQPIQSTKFKSHFRISWNGQTIDLYSADNLKYYGKLTNYTTEYITVKNKDKNHNQHKRYRYVIEQIDLQQSKVAEIVQKLIQTGQPEIPTGALIPSWVHNFLHCESLVFQFNINGSYTQQAFHCPWGQNDSIAFKKTILDNYQSLKLTFLLDSLYSNFEGKLPKGKTYTRDGYRFRYTMTDKQSKAWKKNQPQRDFMKSVKDTINSHINAELKKQDIKLDGINCFESYELTFGKNGRLKKVGVSHYNKPRLKNSLGFADYLADKREIRKCRKKIKQIFSKIDLSFLNSEYEIYRVFSFNHKEAYQLRDNTIY